MISLAFYRIDWKSQQHRPVQPPCPSAAWTDNFRHPLEMAIRKKEKMGSDTIYYIYIILMLMFATFAVASYC